MKPVSFDARFGVVVFPFDVDATFHSIRSKLLSATAIATFKSSTAASAEDMYAEIATKSAGNASDGPSLGSRIAGFLRRREQVHPGDPPRVFRSYDNGRAHNVMPSHTIAAGGRPIMMKVLQK